MNFSDQKLQIKKLTVQDISFIQKLQPDDWADIIPPTRFYLQSKDCFPIKALFADKIVGTGVVIVNNNVAWLANIIVSPGYRNHGLGYQITQYLIEMVKNKCETVQLLSTILGKPIYKKLGFQEVEDYLFFKKGSLNYPISENINIYTPQFKQEILELDYSITGERRANIIEPSLDSAFLYMENSKVTGFYIANLGEGLVIASNPEAGISLLKLRLLEEKITVVPSSNTRAIDFLFNNGFTRYANNKVGVKMFLGKKIDWKPDCIYSRVGGNLG